MRAPLPVCTVSLHLFAGHWSKSREGFPYSLRSHASLPPQPLNRAIQYLRRLSQDPPSQSNLSFMEFTCCIFLMCAKTVNLCNKSSNRIVSKQKEFSSVLLDNPLTQSEQTFPIQSHTPTSRTFLHIRCTSENTPSSISRLNAQWCTHDFPGGR